MLTAEMIADGWIEHNGGPCPVDGDSKPIYMMRGVGIDSSQRWTAASLIWDNMVPWEDQIIAYRPEPRNEP